VENSNANLRPTNVCITNVIVGLLTLSRWTIIQAGLASPAIQSLLFTAFGITPRSCFGEFAHITGKEFAEGTCHAREIPKKFDSPLLLNASSFEATILDPILFPCLILIPYLSPSSHIYPAPLLKHTPCFLNCVELDTDPEVGGLRDRGGRVIDIDTDH